MKKHYIPSVLPQPSFDSESYLNEIQGYKQKWLINNHLPQGTVGLITGQPGIGKSWWLESLAMSISSGTDFLFHFPSVQGKVLFIDQDSGASPLQERFSLLSQTIPFTSNLIVLDNRQANLSIGKEADNKILQSWCAYWQPSLVILETLNKTLFGDENRADDISRYFLGLHKTQKLFPDTTFIINHHNRKDDSNYRGSTAISANVNFHYNIESKNNTNVITIKKDRGQLIKGYSYEITTKGSYTFVRWTGNSFETDELDRICSMLKQQALAYLQKNFTFDDEPDSGEEKQKKVDTTKGLTFFDIRKRTGFLLTEGQLRDTLRIGVKAGKIIMGEKDEKNRFHFYHPDFPPEPGEN